MITFNHKLIICGMALLFFGIIIAIASQTIFSYIFGGLGLFFVIIGCFARDESNEDKTR